MTRTAGCASVGIMPGVPTLLAFAAASAAGAGQACEPAPAPARAEAPSVIVPGYVVPPENAAPSPLADLAAASPWLTRFEAAADALFGALRSRDPERWQPLLGGRWLGARDRQAVEALLADRCGAFAPFVTPGAPAVRRIFGWRVPESYSPADRAEMAARPEAEALACWASPGAGWPQTAAEADNAPGRPWFCARIVYSIRGGTPQWRAFVETPA